MNNFMDALGAKIAPIAQKIGANLYLTVLRDAFMLSFPSQCLAHLSLSLIICHFGRIQSKHSFQICLAMVKMPQCL